MEGSMIQHLIEQIMTAIEEFNKTRLAWGKDPTVNLILNIGLYVGALYIMALHLLRINWFQSLASKAASPGAFFGSLFVAIMAPLVFTLTLLTRGEGVTKGNVLALLVSYGVVIFCVASDWLIAGGAISHRNTRR
jgi:hypothetical protein